MNIKKAFSYRRAELSSEPTKQRSNNSQEVGNLVLQRLEETTH